MQAQWEEMFLNTISYESSKQTSVYSLIVSVDIELRALRVYNVVVITSFISDYIMRIAYVMHACVLTRDLNLLR